MKRSTSVAGKVAVSAALLWWMFAGLDAASVRQAASALTPSTIAASCGLLLLQQVVLAWRWHRILDLMGFCWPVGQSFRWAYVGSFFNQALPSSVGGDAVRIWALHRHHAGLTIAVGSVAIDRLTGLAVLAALVSLAAVLQQPPLPGDGLSGALMAVGPIVVGGLVVMYFLSGLSFNVFPSRIASHVRRVIQALRLTMGRPVPALEVGGLGALASLTGVLAMAVIGTAVGIEVAWPTFVALVGGATLFSVLPVSLGGWGLREASLVALFALVGVHPEPVLAMSITYGLLALFVALPAALLWWTGPHNGLARD